MPAVLADRSLIPALLPPAAIAERGAFHPAAGEVPPLHDGRPIATLILLGWTGGVQWRYFAASAEATDGRPDPLDRWSRRLIEYAAQELGAMPLFPFGGPPHHDFQAWALRAEPVARSPIGLLIHPRWGLWHAYRGALAFNERLPLTQVPVPSSPCKGCLGRPCLRTCRVDAFRTDAYDIGSCAGHVGSVGGTGCRTHGCEARRACPIGAEWAYAPDQAGYHMEAFLRGYGRSPVAGRTAGSGPAENIQPRTKPCVGSCPAARAATTPTDEET